jgi:opacity protein-like surface antigen
MKWFGAGQVCLMAIVFGRPVAAQDLPRADISVGYQYVNLKLSGDDSGRSFPKGWYFDVAGNVTPMVSIVGQASGNYRHFDFEDIDIKIHSFMAGVRGSSQGRVRGYGQFLVGGASVKASDDTDSVSETDLAIQVGGGVNLMGSGPVGLRLGVDYVRVNARDDGEVLGGESLNGFRFAVGVTFGIGSR